MHFLDVLYFNYYSYSIKILKESEPHATTNFMLSFSESLLVNAIIDILSIKWFCYNLGTWPRVLVFVFILGVNYLVYQRSRKSRAIIAAKPTIFGNRKFSIAFTLVFFLITTSWMFWGPIYGKNLLDNCK